MKTDISDNFPIFFIFKCVVDSMIVPRPGKNLYTNEITPAIQ